VKLGGHLGKLGHRKKDILKCTLN